MNQPVRPNTHAKAQVPVQGSTATEQEINAESSNKKLRQPHDRDESPDSGHRGTDAATDPHTKMPQAHEDVERGVVDTDRRGVPSDVPSSRKNNAP